MKDKDDILETPSMVAINGILSTISFLSWNLMREALSSCALEDGYCAKKEATYGPYIDKYLKGEYLEDYQLRALASFVQKMHGV